MSLIFAFDTRFGAIALAFSYTEILILGDRARNARRRSGPQHQNHVQPRPARDQSRPGSPSPFLYSCARGEPGTRLIYMYFRDIALNLNVGGIT